MIEGNKVLVTGGAGFIGSHVVDELVERGYQVYVIDNLSVGEKKNINPKAFYVKGDIRDANLVRAFMRNVKTVFHFAYDATECKSIFSPVLDTDINLLGGMIVLEEAINAGVEKFVFPSSVLVYGVPEYLPMDEKHRMHPDDPYSVSKMAFENYLRVYYELGAITPYIVRFTNTYGPRLRLDNPYKGATQIFMNRCINGKNPIVFGDGTQKRAFTYVEDIKKAIVDVIDHDDLINNPINIGSEFVHDVNEVAQTIIDIINPELKIEYLPKRSKDIQETYTDVKKMHKILKIKAKTTIKEGLKKTIEWAKEQEDTEFKYNWPVEIPHLLDNKYKEKQL